MVPEDVRCYGGEGGRGKGERERERVGEGTKCILTTPMQISMYVLKASSKSPRPEGVPVCGFILISECI